MLISVQSALTHQHSSVLTQQTSATNWQCHFLQSSH